MKRLNLREEDITFDNVKAELNRLFYEIRDLSNASNISKEYEDFLLDRVEMIQSLMGYLTGSSYKSVEIDGKSEYIKLEPIDPKIIYAKTNLEIDFINNKLGIKEINEPVLSEEEKEKQRQEFKDALQKALEDGTKNYLESRPSKEDIEAAVDSQFSDITLSDIKTDSFKNFSGNIVETKQIPLSRELAKILGYEYLFEPTASGDSKITTVLEQVTIHGEGNSTTTYVCSRYNSMGKSRGTSIITDEKIKQLIESKFQQIIEEENIKPSTTKTEEISTQTIGKRTAVAKTSDKSQITEIFEKFKQFMKGLFR